MRPGVPPPPVAALLTVLLSCAASAQIPYWDLADIHAPGQITLYNPDPRDARFGVPVLTVDLNGDGGDEVVVTAMNASGPRNTTNRFSAGEIHVFFWDGNGFRGLVDFRREDPRVMEIAGAEPEAWFGSSLSKADLDGDGFEDLIVGALGADRLDPSDPASERYRAGKVYVVFGHAGRKGGTYLDLADGLPADLTEIVGSDMDDRLGVWTAAGDVDGDGHLDLVLGADRADRPGGTGPEAGKIVILHGPVPKGEQIDLSDPDYRRTVILGVDADDHFGATVACADLDGDGFADVIGAAASHGLSRNVYDGGGSGDGPPGTQRVDSGETWIVWGDSALPTVIDLASPLPSVTTTVFYGKNSFARCGEELDKGDVNGDGITDLFIGSLSTNGPAYDYRRNAGEGYVFYGGTHLRGQAYDLAQTSPPGVVVYGRRESIATDSFHSGDVNGDGYQDLLVGMPHDDGADDRKAGSLIVVYGGPSLPAEIDLADPQVPFTLIEGADRYDDTAYWSAAGDVDGDGLDEVIVNAMSGRSWRNSRFLCGEARVVNGAWLARHPAPPGEVRLESEGEGRTMRVSWDPSPTPGVTAYRVLHGGTPAAGQGEILVPAGAGNHTVIHGVPPHLPCYVRVEAWRDGMESRPTPPHSIITGTLPPPALSVEVETPNRVMLRWDAVDSPDLLGYSIYRRTDDEPPTWEDRIGPGLLYGSELVDDTPPTFAKVRYWITTWKENLLESSLSEPVTAWTLPDRVGKGTLLVNDYDWYTTSDGALSTRGGDPYEMYRDKVLTGEMPHDFWDARMGWTNYPPGLNVLGCGHLHAEVLFQYGLLIWAANARDGYQDDRFTGMEDLLMEYLDRGGTLFLAGWQMGSYMGKTLAQSLHIRGWQRPQTVRTDRLMVPTSFQRGAGPIGPNPATVTASFCDIPDFEPSNEVRVLYRIDTAGTPPVLFAVGTPGELPRAYVLSASPSRLDPGQVLANIAPLIQSVGQGRTETSVPGPTAPLRLAPPYPNPARGPVSFEVRVEERARVAAEVFDVRGRLVRRLGEEEVPAGGATLSWDTRDRFGRPAPAGLYLLCVSAQGRVASRRVMLIR